MITRCPICNAETSRILYFGIDADDDANKIPIRECCRCAIVFSENTLGEFSVTTNEKLYYDSYYGENVRQRFLNEIFIKLFQAERQRQSLNGHKEGYILDIGCGDGTFLCHLGPKWGKYGYEPSCIGREKLKNRTGLHILDSLDSASAKYRDSFDVITLWHSLEHTHQPHRILNSIKTLLKDDGVLFLSVPNYGSLQARIFKQKWFHLDPMRHHIHYTKNTIINLLKQHGFEIQAVNTFSLEYGIFGWWQSFFNSLNLKFNFAYKIIKGRIKRKLNSSDTLNILIYSLTGMPLLVTAFIMAFIEGLFNCGAVVNLKAKKTISCA